VRPLFIKTVKILFQDQLAVARMSKLSISTELSVRSAVKIFSIKAEIGFSEMPTSTSDAAGQPSPAIGSVYVYFALSEVRA